MGQGIYIIRNKINSKFYIGSTKNFHVRKLRHFNELRKNKHHSVHLQRAFNKYSEENFEFIIIETCVDYREREQTLLDSIDLKKDSYNVSSSASGGDLISNHPNRKSIIESITKQLLECPRRSTSYEGDKNPNWRGGKTFCGCGARINSHAKTCVSCQDKSGENNPFFGKKHTEKLKQNLSRLRTGIYNGNQEKAVIIDGIEYVSVSRAARELGVVAATIVFRIKSKTLRFKDYYYKENL